MLKVRCKHEFNWAILKKNPTRINSILTKWRREKNGDFSFYAKKNDVAISLTSGIASVSCRTEAITMIFLHNFYETSAWDRIT